MRPQASDSYRFPILRNPNHTSCSAALWTFQRVADVNYLELLLSSCCPRMFLFSISSSAGNEGVQMIYIFYSWLLYPPSKCTIIFASLICLEKDSITR